jgi:hypothetical protein
MDLRNVGILLQQYTDLPSLWEFMDRACENKDHNQPSPIVQHTQNSCNNTWHHNPEDRDLNIYLCESIESPIRQEHVPSAAYLKYTSHESKVNMNGNILGL